MEGTCSLNMKLGQQRLSQDLSYLSFGQLVSKIRIQRNIGIQRPFIITFFPKSGTLSLSKNNEKSLISLGGKKKQREGESRAFRCIQRGSRDLLGAWYQGLSRYLETGCPNRGFIDFCVSKVWYKIHTTNKIDPIPLQILLFYARYCFVCLIKVTLQLLHLLRKVIFSKFWHKLLGVQTVKKQCSACPNDTLDALRLSPCMVYTEGSTHPPSFRSVNPAKWLPRRQGLGQDFKNACPKH